METISPSDQKKLEQKKLMDQIRHVFSNSTMYQEKYRQAGIAVKDVTCVRDLAKLPFTTKTDLRESQVRTPPYGDFLAVAPELVNRVHRTSGATGQFVYTALTRKDLQMTNECGARAFWAAGLRPHHRVVHCLNYCLWMGGYTDHSNLELTGATIFPFGVGNSRQLVRVIRETGISVISSTPSYPAFLESVVRDELGIEPKELGLRLGLFGGESGLENPSYRNRIAETWGMQPQNANYGVSDVLCNFASVCGENYQLHFLAQGALLAQLIDPATGDDIAIENGVKGELVLTHLEKEAQPLIRYRTSDILEILGTGPCACGRTGFRFRVVGRADDMLNVKGVNVFPNGISQVIQEMVPNLNGEFQIVLDHPSPHTGLNITVEHGADIDPGQMGAIARKLEGRIRTALFFTAKIDLVPPQTIQRTEMGKAVRVLRRY
ncbi:MAG: phenylacetate--CoA ligase family protein [Deltaproteobacteria bacterium]|nr:phenylacetate--CoA ligase family protein [Deltaproteobacteria bacterium]